MAELSTRAVSNQEFLDVIFEDDWQLCHVTSFSQDPAGEEVTTNGAKYWAGGIAKNRLRRCRDGENQYYCISIFKPNAEGEYRRQKAYHAATYVIVADDVNEKLPRAEVEKLPAPSYKLLTSIGSEQWGWILEQPCTERHKVENLLDGLVAKGLAPDGKDPGMKGVTRYVRLPEGSNTKASKVLANDGEPYPSRLYEWNPDRMFAIEQLAAVFNIDLEVARHDDYGQLADEKSLAVRENPLIKELGLLGKSNDGGYRLAKCVNAAEHSNNDPTGAAIWVRPDGSFGYKCHHGHCNGDKSSEITGKNAVEVHDRNAHGGTGLFCSVYSHYMNSISQQGAAALISKLDCMGKTPLTGSTVESERGELFGGNAEEDTDPVSEICARFIYLPERSKVYDTEDKALMSMSDLDKLYSNNPIFRGQNGVNSASSRLVRSSRMGLNKAHGFGWSPEGIEPPSRGRLIFEDEGKYYINTYSGFALTPIAGDVSPWLTHIEYLIPNRAERDVVLDYLSALVQRITEKPAFCIVHRGAQGVGKDLLYAPLMLAMGSHCARKIEVDQLTQWGDYRAGLKLALIPEVDRGVSRKMSNTLKTILAPTASGKEVLNMKGGSVLLQVDVMGAIMTSNRVDFLAVDKDERRYFVVDSYFEKREAEYYQNIDKWMRKQNGAAHLLHFLLNRQISQEFTLARMPFVPDGTKALYKNSLYDYEEMLEALIEEGKPPFHGPVLTRKDVTDLAKQCGCKVASLRQALEERGWAHFEQGQKWVDGTNQRTSAFYSNLLSLESSAKERFEFFVEHRGGTY